MPGLRVAYPDIEWVLDTASGIDYNRKDFHQVGDMEVIPLRWSDSLCKVQYRDCMKSKFLLLNQDWTTWKERAMWRRDKEKEEHLAYIVGADKPFTLVNNNFWTIGKGRKTAIDAGGRNIIHMTAIDGFSLFDWAGVMEKADEIRSVSTSTLYMFELLDLKCPIHLYPRLPYEKDLKNVDYIFSKPYITHE